MQPHACNYLTNQAAQTAFVHPSYPMSTEIYAQLIAKGFRRNGDDVYIPQCPSCNACIPARVKATDFKPNRNQTRCLKKNRHTEANIKPAVFDPAHFNLYQRYQQVKHPDSSMQYASKEDYIRFLSSTWCDSFFVEFKIDQRLVAVAVIDHVNDALSAVYTFFDTKYAHYSLGVYAVLWQLEYAKYLKLDWVYLGYWIADCQKMSYKSQYQPMEIFRDNQWKRYEQTE